MSAPRAYINWINAHPGFNPRSQKSSNALSEFVVTDLRKASAQIDAALTSGKLREVRNAEVQTQVVGRNVDLVICESNVEAPGRVVIAVENKTIMAAHGKARKNRFGDLIAYSNHIHNHNRDCIAAGILVINFSGAYKNPDPFATALKRAKFDMLKVVGATVELFANLPLREQPDEPSDQPEALAVIIVSYDGASPSKLVTGPPSPPKDSPLNYGNFIKRIAKLYSRRFT